MHHFQLGPISVMIDACSLCDSSRLSRLQGELKKGREGASAATSLAKAISSFHLTSCFTLAAGWLPPGPSGVVTAEGWPRSHGHRLTLLFMAAARLTAAPEMGNIAHLAGLLGAVMPQRPVLWQPVNVPREKQRESD